MGSILEITFSVFMFFSTLYLITASDNMNDDSLDRGAHSDRGGLWFGPRLGKRSLQLIDEDKSETFLRLLEAAEALKNYYDQMPYQMQADAPQKVAKKVIFTPKLGRAVDPYVEKKYDNLDFTPRLGRKLPERLPAPPEEEDSVPDPAMSNPRANYFSPRLGRNYNFSPRLGRELYDIYPRTQIRVARSINKTKTN